MAHTPIQPITVALQSMAQDAFDQAFSSYMQELNPSILSMNLLGAQADANATAAGSSAALAAAAAASAAASSVASAGAANVAPWVSGQTYSAYASAISTIDFQTYRAMLPVTSATDPANDPANWVCTSGVHQTVILTSTQAWSPPFPIRATVTVTGGGGSAGSGSTGADGSISASGAGTTIKFNLLLSPSVSYAVVIGGPGAAAVAGGVGGDGTASSFSGSGISTLTGGAGKAGPRVLSGNNLTESSFPRGGIGSGGDVNIEGGPGTAAIGVSVVIGGSLSSATSNLLTMPGGGSHWGASTTVGNAPTNYGAGSPGVKGGVAGQPGRQGVIKIEWN